MKKLLLASAGVLALGGVANANGWPPMLQNVQDYYAAALAINVGEVAGNTSSTSTGQDSSAALSGSFTGFRGVANVNQNAGANSGLQNSVAISYIEGCDCNVVTPIIFGLPRGDSNANSVAANVGQVVDNSSTNSSLLLLPGTEASATLSSAFGGATGLVQVNQNAGANSLLQNATALTMIENVRGVEQDRDAWAIAVNAGQVTGSGNSSTDSKHTATGSITGSFNEFRGVANVNQNVGANSLMQNSSALSAITYNCNCAIEDLSTTIAAAGNLGSVTGNSASASLGSAGVSMTNSFNGTTGVTQVSQNAGANSMMQNAVAIGAIYQRTN